MTLCNLWPKDAREFKRRFRELPDEACNLIWQLCKSCALGIDLQKGVLYLEETEDIPQLEELVKRKIITPVAEVCMEELRGKECRRYLVNASPLQRGN